MEAVRYSGTSVTTTRLLHDTFQTPCSSVTSVTQALPIFSPHTWRKWASQKIHVSGYDESLQTRCVPWARVSCKTTVHIVVFCILCVCVFHPVLMRLFVLHTVSCLYLSLPGDKPSSVSTLRLCTDLVLFKHVSALGIVLYITITLFLRVSVVLVLSKRPLISNEIV
jgi:hypothetical protein